MHGRADVLELAVLHREALRAGDLLHARLDGRAGVAERDAFEIVVVAAHEVEQHGVAVAVEDHFAVTGADDGDGLVRRAVLT